MAAPPQIPERFGGGFEARRPERRQTMPAGTGCERSGRVFAHGLHRQIRGGIIVALIAGSIAAMACAGIGRADDNTEDKAHRKSPADSFMRLTRDAHDAPGALETSIVSHRATKGRDNIIVDLISALHVGEKNYYEQLNREFAKYDAVLYELVAPESANAPKLGAKGGDHPLVMLQNGMKDVLDLEFQLGAIDYTRRNMVHADMSPDEFARSMKERGETMFSMIMRMMGDAMARQNDADAPGAVELLLALLDKNRALALKRIVAAQLCQADGSLAALEGPQGSTLISGRNQVALKVLRQQIAAGKRKIAIFYGAGHMPDMQQRLEREFGLKPVDTRWLTAWDLQPAKKSPAGKKDSK